jgi:gliding motility-associated-like protein
MKLMAFILILAGISVATFAQSPQLAWARQMKGTSLNASRSIGVDSSGYVYTGGILTDSVDFDPGPNVYNLYSTSTSTAPAHRYAGFISKLDSSGNFVWAKSIGVNNAPGYASVNSICIDIMGNVYATGQFQGIVDFDPGPGIFNMSVPTGIATMFICKLNNNGNFVWAKKIGTNSVIAFSIKCDAAGNTYSTGYFDNTADFDPGAGIFNLTSAGSEDAFILKLDATGNFAWSKQIAGADMGQGYVLSLDAQGNVYTLGWFRGGIDADPGPGVQYFSSSYPDLYVLKLDNSGNLIWAKQLVTTFTTIDESLGGTMDVDSQGNVYIVGTVIGQVDLDPGPGTAWVSSNTFIMYSAKWTTNGSYIWSGTYAGSAGASPVSICAKNPNMILITGCFFGTANFGSVSAYPLTASGEFDGFILKQDINGNTIWAGRLGGPDNTLGFSITADSHNNIYTAGHFSDTTDFDPGTGIFNLVASAPFVDGKSDVFVHKLVACANSTSSTINITACNSYTLNSQTYTSSGTYIQTVSNSSGCDSMITLNLTITPITNAVSISSCNSFTWNGQILTSSGIYIDTFVTADGCDSIVTMNLVINNSGSSITTTVSCFAYFWQGQSYTVSGIYMDTLQTITGCDSILKLFLTIRPKSYNTIAAAICPGANYAGYNVPGIYIDTFVAANGCDSIRTLELTSAALSVATEKAVICNGQNYMGYTVNGIYRDTLAGCLVRELTLTVENDCDLVAVPNAFTPNGDGLNDLFKPVIRQTLQEYRFMIFNRWGQVIFETTTYSSAWDGSYKGKPQPPGTYVYSVYLKTLSGNEKNMNGTVQVIR